MRSRSTTISMRLSCVDIRFHLCVFRDAANIAVDSVEVDGCVRRHGCVAAVSLHAPGTYCLDARIDREDRERAYLGAARAPEAPRLLEHTAAAPASLVVTSHRVVVSSRGKKSAEASSRRFV